MTDPLFWVWCEMRHRCSTPTHKAYANYGGRGITVCERWEESFANFRADMGERPDGTSLDRINNDGPYSPENCRWATSKQQNSNRRNCIYVLYEGERMTLRECCRRRSLKYRPIVKRIQDRGWPIEKALTVPLGTGKHAHKWKDSQ